MKRQILLGLVVIFGCYDSTAGSSSENLLHENKYDKVLTFVNGVQKRYYVIRRLEGAVDHLLSCYGSLCGQKGGEAWEVLHQRCLHGEYSCQGGLCHGHMCRDCGLKRELLLVSTFWQDCLSYKRIMNDMHIRELLIHLIVLYDALLKVCGKRSGLTSGLLITRENFSQENFSRCGLDELLDTVDILAATSKSLFASKPFVSKSLSHTTQVLASFLVPELREIEGAGEKALMGEAVYESITNELLFIQQPASEQSDGEPAVGEPAVDEPDGELLQVLSDTYRKDDFLVNTTVRFYLLKRVTCSLSRLSLLARTTPLSFVCSQLPPADAFQSPVVRECLHTMVAEGSLQPLFTLWESIGSYRYISDPYLIREILLIMVQVYKMAMKLLVPHQEQEAVQADQVIDVYNAISLLPFPELFDLLDELTQQSLSIATVYQEGVALGWKAALKQYWWLPPVMIAGCATLYLRVKHVFSQPHYRQSSLNKPILCL